ncbi:MAG: cysteine desulfurase family protein [Lachnospiraceae bacterium]
MEYDEIYVDNAATTALSDTALTQMLPYFKTLYGNPSSAHSLGARSKKAVEGARRDIAEALGARNNEIFFSSGGTESDNWALFGNAMMQHKKGRHIITSSIEHSAVYRTTEYLASKGYRITYLPADSYGRISPDQLESAICDDTILVSIMLANNELGTIQPIKELCEIAHRHQILFHTDAVQAVGHIPIDVRELGVDLLSLSSHKFRGPKGVGALYVRLGVALPPMIFGGGQEKNKRSGTENVPGIVGMAAALQEAVRKMDSSVPRITAMRDRLIRAALQIDGCMLTGHPQQRLPGLASFVFSGLASKAIVAALSNVGILASSGSACSSGSTELSRSLQQSFEHSGEVRHESEYGALRISLNECNTEEEIDYIIQQLPNVIAGLKAARHPLF